MGKRLKHPDKDIEAAILYAEKNGWVYKDAGKSAHAWGRLLCPLHTREGHKCRYGQRLEILITMLGKSRD